MLHSETWSEFPTLKKIYFILFLAAWALHCCAWVFSSCGVWTSR